MERLILPDSAYIKSYIGALREGYFFSIYPTLPEEEIKKIEADPFPHLEKLNRQGGTYIPGDGVERPQGAFNRYWLVKGEDFLGEVMIRFHDDDFRETQSGHIGYGIRPAVQGQGFSKKILALALDIAREQGFLRIIMAVDNENTRSIRAIESNGGVYLDQKPSIFFKGHFLYRYKIDLTGKD